jgi:hypothetical protein
MITNYIYVFRLNEYNNKIKSHIVLKHPMYSTFYIKNLSYHFENDLAILTSIHIYNTSTTYYTSSTWFLQHKGNTSITYYTFST